MHRRSEFYKRYYAQLEGATIVDVDGQDHLVRAGGVPRPHDEAQITP